MQEILPHEGIACKFDALADLEELQIQSRQIYRTTTPYSDLSSISVTIWSLHIEYGVATEQPLMKSQVLLLPPVYLRCGLYFLLYIN